VGGHAEGELIAAVSVRDERARDALGEIYRRHGGAVWSVVDRVCGSGSGSGNSGGRSSSDAEDICAAVFAEVWAQPHRFAVEGGSLRSRLVAEAHARAVALARQRPAAGPSEPAGHAEALDDDARRAIEQLAPVERDAILLCYVGGHPCGEAARRLGVSEDEIKGSIRRGLLNLRRALEAEGVSR
jgi:RNA polymerase sigma-70 factor (ECF subfamily)